MRVLVTGSAGFIGRHVVAALKGGGHCVLGLDRSPEGPAANDRDVRCDILDVPALLEHFRRFEPEAVVHLAARTDLGGKTLDGYAANVRGVENVVEAVRQTSSVHRAIYTSTQLVCKLGYVPRHDTDYRPSTVYGQSKIRTEQIVREKDGGGVTWCLVRPTTVWGPGMSPHYQGFLRMIQRGRYVHVGRRPVRKTYGFIGNVVHQYQALLVADAEAITRKTLYLGDYQPLSLRAWANEFQRALAAPRIRTVPRPIASVIARGGDWINALGWGSFPFNSFRLGNVMTESVYDLRETEAICGPLPFTMEMGIEKTVRWFRTDSARQAVSAVS